MHVYTCKSEIPKVNFLLFVFSFIFEPKFVTVTSKREIQILLIKSSLVYLDWSFSYFNVQNSPTAINVTSLCFQTIQAQKKGMLLDVNSPGERRVNREAADLATGSRQQGWVHTWYGFITPAVQIIPSNTREELDAPSPASHSDCPFLSLVLILVGLHQVGKWPYLLTGKGRQEQDLESSGTQTAQHLVLDCGTRTSDGSSDIFLSHPG